MAACLPNDVDIVVAFLGTARLGAIWVGVNKPLAAPEKAYLLRDSGARVFLGPEDVLAPHAARHANGSGRARPVRRERRRVAPRRRDRPRVAGRDRLHERHHRLPEGRRAQPPEPAAARRGRRGVGNLRTRAAPGRAAAAHDPEPDGARAAGRVPGRLGARVHGPDRRGRRGRVGARREGRPLRRGADDPLRPADASRCRARGPRQPAPARGRRRRVPRGVPRALPRAVRRRGDDRLRHDRGAHRRDPLGRLGVAACPGCAAARSRRCRS